MVANLNNRSEDINIFRTDGSKINGVDLLVTGYTVQMLVNSAIKDEFTIVILGDASGDATSVLLIIL